MRTVTITKTVFPFSELSVSAKETARDWYRAVTLQDEWFDCVDVDAKEVAQVLGVSIDKIYFSGFSSQGDGACFEGGYSYSKGWRKALRSQVGGDDLIELERIGSALQAAQKNVFYKADATVTHSGHYYHSGCMDIEVDVSGHPSGGHWDDTGETAQDITEALKSLADWIYKKLEAEHDHLTSDETIDAGIEANEYEFYVNGIVH